MANLGGRYGFEDREEKYMRRATEWDEVDDDIHAVALRTFHKLAKIRREKRKLPESLQFGTHAKFNRGIRRGYFGFPQFSRWGRARGC